VRREKGEELWGKGEGVSDGAEVEQEVLGIK